MAGAPADAAANLDKMPAPKAAADRGGAGDPRGMKNLKELRFAEKKDGGPVPPPGPPAFGGPPGVAAPAGPGGLLSRGWTPRTTPASLGMGGPPMGGGGRGAGKGEGFPGRPEGFGGGLGGAPARGPAFPGAGPAWVAPAVCPSAVSRGRRPPPRCSRRQGRFGLGDEKQQVMRDRGDKFNGFLNLRQKQLNDGLLAKKDEKEYAKKAQEQIGLFTEFLPEALPLVVREYAPRASTAAPGAAREDFTETLLWQPCW